MIAIIRINLNKKASTSIASRGYHPVLTNGLFGVYPGELNRLSDMTIPKIYGIVK